MTDEETIVMSEEAIRQEADAAQQAALEAADGAVDEAQQTAEETVGAASDALADAAAGAGSEFPEDPFAQAADSVAPATAPSEPVLTAAPVAEEPKPKKKKRKIDLKSRLSSVRGKARPSSAGRPASASFPPPPSGAVPAPKILGTGLPKVSSPFAPPEPVKKVTAQAQTIKVEMGEEVLQERKKAGRKSLLFVALAVLAALPIGFLIGRTYQDGVRGRQAIAGASKLATGVDEANKSMATMSDALRKAVEQLGQDEFPEDLADVLKATNVPFSSADFQGKGVGGLPSETLGALLRYTSGVDELNTQKDKLRNLLSAAKPQVLKYIAQKEKPVVNFSVMFSKQGDNIIADLLPNKEPFASKEKWPPKYTVLKPGKKKPIEAEATRFDGKMKLFGDKPVVVPMSEKTVGAFTSQKLVYSLKKALSDTKNLVDGKDSQIPSEQTNGLLKDGARLIEDLKKIAAAGG